MSGWNLRPVSELQDAGVLLVEDGNHGEYRPRPSEFVEEGMSFIRAADMSSGTVDFLRASKISESARSRIRKGIGRDEDVLLSHKGTVGKVAFVPVGSPEFVCSPQTTFWRSLDHDQLEPRFLLYYLKSPAFTRLLAARSAETDMAPYVSLTEQRRFPVLLPPVYVQRMIAGMLGALDGKIESNRSVIAVAEALVESLYSEAVAGRDFGPFHIAMSVSMGSAFKGAHFTVPGVGRRLLRIRDLKTFEPQVWTTEHRKDETVIVPGSIVVGMDAEFRATIWLGESAVLNQRVCTFQPRAPVGRAFVRQSLDADLAMQERAKSGTTVIHLNKADIDGFRVPLLTDNEHRALAVKTEPLIDAIVARSAESQRLAALRDALMPELLSGRLRVEDVSQTRMGGTG